MRGIKGVLKGSVLTGSWVSFDEFHQFDPKLSGKFHHLFKDYFSSLHKGMGTVNVGGEEFAFPRAHVGSITTEKTSVKFPLNALTLSLNHSMPLH